jgi:hypothetical protein
MSVPPGVTFAEIEAKHGVAFPDMRAYFLDVDGMGSRAESDKDWFFFWPLRDVISLADEFEARFTDDQSSYYSFSDYSLCLPAFAVRLDRSERGDNPVIAVFSDNKTYSTNVVARSFGGFIEMYLGDTESRDCLRSGMPGGPPY